jgi:hypothetical protein
MAGAFALVQQPGAVPDRHPAGVQIHLVVGQHEADALVLAQGLTEGGAGAGVVGGDVVRAAGGAEPAHAMGETRRGEPRLGIAEPLADAAEDGGFRHPHAVEADDAVAAGHVLVERVEYAPDLDAWRVHRDEEHRRAGGAERVAVVLRHDDREPGADRAGDQPFLAVDDEVAGVSRAPRRRQEHRRVRARTRRRLGHHKARADVASGERAQILLFLGLVGDLFQEMHVGFVGGEAVHRDRAER